MRVRCLVALLMVCAAVPLRAQEVRVGDVAALREAVRAAQPGTTILIAPGQYEGGLWFENIHGQEGKPITLAGADPANPPRFVGKTEAFHFAEASYLTLRDLSVSGQSGNGINIDDGGTFETPAHHVVLERLRVSDIGPTGNHDGLKLSGLDDFLIRDCTVERWGGSGIDMVGCHRGRIEACAFKTSDTAGSNAIQNKGGTSDILIRKNRFDYCGDRAINIGGSTGLQFFRPKVEGFEARAITVEGNVFVGSVAAVAFVGVDGAVVRFNTIIRPGKWALRILQETTAPGFVPCRNGAFTDNLIVFRSDQWGEGGCNIGPGTAPQTFVFARNAWYCEDRPDRSQPTSPTIETGGVCGIKPLFVNEATGDFAQQADSPLKAYGYGALPAGEPQ